MPFLPVIALVGRPNVGKSTLFNRLTQTRDALVADQPGLTRDRQYGAGKLGESAYLVVDTGGLVADADGVEAYMEKQVIQAIGEADFVFFMVDARVGCTAFDIEISHVLRRTKKPVFIVANKSESLENNLANADFYQLGFEQIQAITATHGGGVQQLINTALKILPPAESIADDNPYNKIKVAFVGRPNVGKSTLINRLLGEERVVAFDKPGTTRDSIHIDFEVEGREYILIDTAGVRRRGRIDEMIEKFSVIKTLQAIAESNVVFLVLDAQQGIGEQDAHLAGHIIDAGRALVVLINKWDGLSHDQRDQIKQDFERKLPFLGFAKNYFISALHGSGVGLIMAEARIAYQNAMRDLATPKLTRILEQAVQAHQPPLVKGKRIKLRYAHQGGKNPPIVVIHGNQTASTPVQYQRYLTNTFYKALQLKGTPLRIEFKTGKNPFENKKNKLTDRQIKKKQRLKRFTNR